MGAYLQFPEYAFRIPTHNKRRPNSPHQNYFGRAPVNNVTIMTTQETHRDSIQAGGPNFAMRDIKNGGFSHDSGNLTATDNESTKKYFSSRDSTEDVEAGRL